MSTNNHQQEPITIQDPEQEKLLLVVVAVLVPWVAILLMKGMVKETLACFVLWLLFYIPGLVYAIYLITLERGPIALGENRAGAPRAIVAENSYQYRASAEAGASEYKDRPAATDGAPVANEVPAADHKPAPPEASPVSAMSAMDVVETSEPQAAPK